MLVFKVNDMTCGHCVATITTALNHAVPGVAVDIDLPSHSVRFSGMSDATAIETVIRDAGYSPLKIN